MISSLIYPRRCPVCTDIVYPKDKYCCDRCKNVFKKIEGPRCLKCSRPVENEVIEYCYDCQRLEFSYERGFSIWLYDDKLKKSIIDFKYKGKKEYADYYAEEMFETLGKRIKSLNADCMIPVPIHKKKYNIRGFNQAQVIAKKLGNYLDIPVIDYALIRVINTTPQKELDNKERRKNLMKAFDIKDKQIFKRDNINNVLLIDDIYTTGSTIEACTRKLKQAGVSKVYFAALCIGIG
ncbi:MAG: ComF family protein [Lachnospiraceae bacterium]|nr:ComF family protein [Lachnospiraceae bacterium]